MIRRWLRRRRPRVGEVTVTIEADVSRFVAAMERAADDVRELKATARYRRRIAHERSLAQAQVGVLLDDWCRSYGWDPVEVWRAPRARAEQEARDRARLRVAWYVGGFVPRSFVGGGEA